MKEGERRRKEGWRDECVGEKGNIFLVRAFGKVSKWR